MKRIQGGRSLALRTSSAAVVAVVAMGGLAASAQALEIKVPGVATVGVGEGDKVADVKLGSGTTGKGSTVLDVPLGNTKVHVGTGGGSTADVTVGSDGGGTTPTPKDGKDGKDGKPGVIRIIRGGNGSNGTNGKDGKNGTTTKGSSTTTKGSGTITVTRTVGASTAADTSTGNDSGTKADPATATDTGDGGTTADDLTSSSGHSVWFWGLWSLLALLIAGTIGWLLGGRRRRKDEDVPADDNEAFLASLEADEKNDQGAHAR